ncbi:MAG: SCO family protein [Limisphaerales bacterium]
MSSTASAPASARDPVAREITVFLSAIVVVGLAVAGMTALMRRPSAAPLPDMPKAKARSLVDFSLVNWDGRTVTRTDLKDKFLVVSFVFTSCSATCFEVSRQLERVQAATAAEDGVRLVSFSMDPRTDQPPVLAQFARRCNADPRRWFLLTGDKTEVHRVIAESFLARDLSAVDQPSAGFRHHYAVALVDRSGTVRHTFNGLAPTVAADVLDALDKLRKEGRKP